MVNTPRSFAESRGFGNTASTSASSARKSMPSAAPKIASTMNSTRKQPPTDLTWVSGPTEGVDQHPGADGAAAETSSRPSSSYIQKNRKVANMKLPGTSRKRAIRAQATAGC